MRQKIFLICFLIAVSILIISTSLASASLWSWLTGKASFTQPTNVTLTVSQIRVGVINGSIADQSVTESGKTDVVLYVNVSIPGSTPSNINTSSVQANFTKSGESIRQNLTCAPLNSGTDWENFSCTISIWYWDGAGMWNISAYAKDNNGNGAYNGSATFNLLQTAAIQIAPTNLTWPVITPGATNQTSNNDPTMINNTGNKPITAGNIQVKALDLYGGTTTYYYIDAGNFSVAYNQSNGGSPPLECANTNTMQNNTFVSIASAILPVGNNSNFQGNQSLYYCLMNVTTNLTSQTYSTAGGGAWTIKIV